MKWNSTQDNYLKNNYGNISSSEIASYLSTTSNAVRQRAMHLKVNNRTYNLWTNDEIKLLQENYPSKSITELITLFPQRSWLKIKAEANKIGLIRQQRQKEQINGNCEKLLNDTPETFYWIGFLLADGHFSKENRLSCNLSSKDILHLDKLSKFLKTKVSIYNHSGYEQCGLKIMDKYNVQKIKNKFDINNRKTYFPPDFEIYKAFSADNLFSLIIGYIDGDGCIKHQTNRTDCVISIQIHASWLKFLYFIQSFFENNFNIKLGIPIINKRGYAFISFGNCELLKKIKQKAIDIHIPIMNRKWSMIDLNKISRYTTTYRKRLDIIKLYNDGIKPVKISKMLNISNSSISRTIKKYNNNSLILYNYHN